MTFRKQNYKYPSNDQNPNTPVVLGTVTRNENDIWVDSNTVEVSYELWNAVWETYENITEVAETQGVPIFQLCRMCDFFEFLLHRAT